MRPTVTYERRRAKLTKTLIDRLEYNHGGPAQQVLWDIEIPNLGVRIYPTGKRTFVVQYSLHGRWRLMAIDRYGVITLNEARKRAKKTLGEVSQDRDPMELRRRLGRALTVKELAERYNEYQKDRKISAGKDKSRLTRWVIPQIGTRKADTIDLDDIQRIHDRISKNAPYEANRTVAMLSKMFNLAKQWKVFPPELPNPTKGVTRNKEISRSEYVTQEKLPDLTAAIDTEKNVYVRHCFWLLLLTGMRRGELLNTKWEHVDLQQQRIWLSDTKSGQPRYVHLSTAAVELIKETPKMLKNEYLLPGQVPGMPLHNIDKPWGRIREAAGTPRLRIHDLRRTAGSYMIQAGTSIHAVKEVLGHQSTRTTEIYARLAEQQSKDAVEAHGAALMELSGKRNGRS